MDILMSEIKLVSIQIYLTIMKNWHKLIMRIINKWNKH